MTDIYANLLNNQNLKMSNFNAMKANRAIVTYQRLRKQPLWRLLAADNGPIIIGLLQFHFFENERSIPASIFYERINRDLEELRIDGENIPQSAQQYISDWLSHGYLERRFPTGATEEEYELSSAAASAIRFINSLVEPRTVATESRLATVIHQLVRLSEETDANPQTRIAALKYEREKIDREIEAIEQGKLEILSDHRALERSRDIIALADEIVGDFRHVRDEFLQLNKELRIRITDNEGSRGEVLVALFAGVDVISESDAGLTFSAFWRLLTDPEQSSILDDAVEKIMSRHFANQLEKRERRFLSNLTTTLLEQSNTVHDVLQHFARSLKHFVQSREYLEHRRLNHLFKEAQRAGIALKDNVKATNLLDYSLILTSSRLNSIGQWTLYDPTWHTPNVHIIEGDASHIDIHSISELVTQSEIDFRTLKNNIKTILQELTKASIADLLTQFPATQGLGSVVGYLTLGCKYGVHSKLNETAIWEGNDGILRRARIPIIYFLREKIHELFAT